MGARRPHVDRATCSSPLLDPRIWFPSRPDDEWENRTAKMLCAVCPLRVACAEGALELEPGAGIWGGLTPRERHRERAKRAGLPVRHARATQPSLMDEVREGVRVLSADGCSCATIALRLGVSERTVQRHQAGMVA